MLDWKIKTSSHFQSLINKNVHSKKELKINIKARPFNASENARQCYYIRISRALSQSSLICPKQTEVHLENNYGCGFGEKIHRKLRKCYDFCFELVYGFFGFSVFFCFCFWFFCLFNSTGRSTASLD